MKRNKPSRRKKLPKESRAKAIDQAIKAAQALFRKAVPRGRLLSEELIAERRAEAERE